MNEQAQKIWLMIVFLIVLVALAVTALPFAGLILVAFFVIGCLTKNESGRS